VCAQITAKLKTNKVKKKYSVFLDDCLPITVNTDIYLKHYGTYQVAFPKV